MEQATHPGRLVTYAVVLVIVVVFAVLALESEPVHHETTGGADRSRRA